MEARNEYGRTPLMYAAGYNENLEVLQELLDAGADATAKNGGRTLTHCPSLNAYADLTCDYFLEESHK